jgi:peptidyl-prolyl cis-trans isomerase D
MFEFIRTHQRLMQIILALLIIPSFLFFGNVDSSMFGEPANLVATVGKRAITQQEWDNAQNEQINRYRQMAGAQFDPKLFESPEAKQRVLDGLIEQQVLQMAIDDKNLLLANEVLVKKLTEIPAFLDADGKFSKEQYQTVLKQQGLTGGSFDARFRRDMLMQQFSESIQKTAFAPTTVSNRIADIIEQEREVQELLIKTSDFTDKVKVTDEMIKGYYNKNSKKFEIPDQINAEYMVLNSETLASTVTVPDAELKANYDSSKQRYTQPEQRRASHILLNVKKDGSDKDKVKASAQALLEKARANPADFAKLAKENSEDKGSGERGGDLEFFGRGQMVPAFDEAAFKLKKGDISDLVLTEFGYHIIQLVDIKPETVKPFDEVKAQILDEMSKPLIAKKFADMSSAFADAVEDRSDNLQAALDKLKKDKLELKIETVSGLGRLPNAGMAPGVPYNHVKFLGALFSEDSIKNKRNTQAVEVAPGVLVAGRVLEYKPVAARPLIEVQASIREILVRMEADKLTAEAGKAKLAALKVKADDVGFAAAKRISRARQPEIHPAAVQSVMTVDASKLPAFVGVELPGQGYAVYRVNKVEASATPDAARRQSMPQQLAGSLASQEMRAFVDVLKEKAKVKIVRPAVTASASAAASASASAEASAKAK